MTTSLALLLAAGLAWRAVSSLAADPGAPVLSAKIDGKAWTSNRQIAVLFKLGGAPSLNLTGFGSGSPTSKLGFNIVLAKDGDYLHDFDLAPGVKASHGSFKFDQLDPDPAGVLAFQNGQIAITKYDPAAQTVSGTFSGTAANKTNTRTVQITDGSFANIPLQTQ